MNIDQSAMYYISMDLNRQALQTNATLFSNFENITELLSIFKLIVALDLCKRGGGGGGIYAEQHVF